MDQIISLATERQEMQVLFIEVAHLLRPPAAFFKPGVLTRVLERAFRKAFGPHSPALEDRLQAS
jgi:hypothetical protein